MPGELPEWQTDIPPLLDDGYYCPGQAELALGGLNTPRLDGNPHLAQGRKASPFQDLSSYLGDKWKTAQQGLDFIDSVLKANVDNFVTGLRKPLFVHSQDWDMDRRPQALRDAMTVGQLYMYATQTAHSDGVFIRALDTQLSQIQVKVSSISLPPLRSLGLGSFISW
jgi:hypothetical protein